MWKFLTSSLFNKDRDDSFSICSRGFTRDLQKLRDLRSFLIEQAVALRVSENENLSFGSLNLLRYSVRGRMPSQDEWNTLERLSGELFSHLSDPLRRRFVYSRLAWWVPFTATALGALALLSLIACTWVKEIQSIIPFYVIWLASLGCIGSLAFIGMNALSVQDDATFDFSNTKLLVLRIVLGALFGVVLTLPFGFHEFLRFVESLMNPGEKVEEISVKSALLLLSPFVLGFSTTLVIMILNRLVVAVQALFGGRTGVSENAEPRVQPREV